MNKIKIEKILKSFFLIALGNLCYSLALNLFLVDNQIAAGGFAGIATLINYFVKVPIGTTVFIMNLPLVIWAFIVNGRSFAIKCVLGNLIFTVISNTTSFLPVLTHNKLIAAVLGGILYGIGITIMVKIQAAAGGTDLLSRLMIRLKPFRKMTVGQMVFYLDTAVVFAALFVYGNIMQSVYTVIGILVYSKTSDALLGRYARKKESSL